ncbi:uncharacterized protein [Heptranchias perlo]|uniref:uncharacterized protein n=1 Tax=Heptranchias perlo TaxID=212740 RepID=UPI00355A67A8
MGSSLEATKSLFTSYPSDTVALTKRPLNISCAAVEKDRRTSASIIWFHNLEDPIPGLNVWVYQSHTGFLFFPSLREEDFGKYTCKATLGLSSINATFNIYKAYIEPVFYSPSSQSVSAGESVSFQCVSGESRPLVEIRWTKDRRNVSEGFQFQGHYGGKNSLKVSGTLRIVNVSKEDEGEYICVTHNPLLNVTVYSTPATLKVKALLSKLLITKDPESITVAVGKTATIHCTIQGFPRPNVMWYKNNKPLNNSGEHKRDGNRQVLMLRNVSLEDEGFYHCEGNNGNEIVTSQAAYLLPAVMDWKFIGQPRNVIARKGDSTTLQCRPPFSRPPARVSWFKNNYILNSWENPHLVSKEDGDLIFSSVQESDDGVYFCRASNPHVSRTVTSQRVSLKVLVLPTVTVYPKVNKVLLGSGATLHCQAEGSPAPSVVWYKGDQPIKAGRRMFLGFQNLTLYISRVIKRDEDLYICEATNLVGRSSQSAILTVTVAPVIVSFTNDLTAVNGSSAALTCTAIGDGIIVYSWYKDGHLIKNPEPKYRNKGQEMLLIPRVNLTDEGTYRCVAASALGRDERTGRLRVHGIYECEAVNEAGSAKRSVTVYISAPGPDQLTDEFSTASPYISAPITSTHKEHSTILHSDILTAITSNSGSIKPNRIYYPHSPSSKTMAPLTSTASIGLQTSVSAAFVTLGIPETSTVRPFPSRAVSTIRPFPAPPSATVRPFPSPTISTVRPRPSPTISTQRPIPFPAISPVRPFPSPISTVRPFPSRTIPTVRPIKPSPTTSTERPSPSPTISTVKPFPSPISTVRPFPSPTISTVKPFPSPISTVRPFPSPISTVRPFPSPISTVRPFPSPISTVRSFPSPAISTVRPFPSPAISTVRSFPSPAISTVRPFPSPAISTVRPFPSPAISTVRPFPSPAISTVKPFPSPAISTVRSFPSPAISTVRPFPSPAISTVRPFPSPAISTVRPFPSPAISTVRPFPPPAISTVRRFPPQTISTERPFPPQTISTERPFPPTAISKVRPIPSPISAVRPFPSPAISTVRPFPSPAISTVRPFPSPAISTVRPFPFPISTVRPFPSLAMSTARSFPSHAVSTVRPFTPPVTSTMKPFPPPAMSTVRPLPSPAVFTVRSFPSHAVSTVRPFTPPAMSTVKPFPPPAMSTVRPLPSPAVFTVRSFPSRAMSTVRPFTPPVMSTVKPFSSSATNTMKPFSPPAISTMNTFPTLVTPVALDSPSMGIPLPKQHSTPMDVALNLTRVQVFPKVNDTTQASTVTSLLKIYLSTNPGKKTIFTQKRLKMLTSNSTLPSLGTYLHYLSKAATKYSSEPTAWNSNCTTSQPFQSTVGTSGTIIREKAQVKESSSYFALEKHDIPIVAGVTVSLTMIFITMGIYSVRQKKNENRETERRLLRDSRMSSQNTGRFEMHTHDNRAFEDDSPRDAVEQTPDERQSVTATSPKQSSVKAIRVTAEFALVRQSESLFSISGNNNLQTWHKDSSKVGQQEIEIPILSRSRSSPSHHENKVKNPNTWKQSALFPERPLTSVLMVEPNSSPFTKDRQKVEMLTRSNSIPCYIKKALRREERAFFNAGLHSDNKIHGASHFSLQTTERQHINPGVLQLQTKPTSSDLSKSLSGSERKSTEIRSVAADVLVYSQLPAAPSLPTPVPNTAAVLFASTSHKQSHGLACELLNGNKLPNLEAKLETSACLQAENTVDGCLEDLIILSNLKSKDKWNHQETSSSSSS